MSVAKIVTKLRKNKAYRKKRDLKTLNKGGSLADVLQRTAEQLTHELEKVEKEIKNFP